MTLLLLDIDALETRYYVGSIYSFQETIFFSDRYSVYIVTLLK